MKERSALVPLLVRFTLQWLFIILLFFIIFFSWFMKQAARYKI